MKSIDTDTGPLGADSGRSRAGAVRQALPGLDAALAALVFDTVGAGLAYIDRDLRYVLVNPALATMNGRAVEAHEGRRLRDVIEREAAATWRAA